jgi:acetyl esterase/lipase
MSIAGRVAPGNSFHEAIHGCQPAQPRPKSWYEASLFVFLVIAAGAASTVAAQQSNPLTLANTPVPPGQRIAYGGDSLQFGELRVPATGGPHPVAVVVHGGCWLAQLGELDRRAVALDNMRPLAAALAEAGIATWNIEYRRLGNEGGG